MKVEILIDLKLAESPLKIAGMKVQILTDHFSHYISGQSRFQLS
jgi:hypothetical protein